MRWKSKKWWAGIGLHEAEIIEESISNNKGWGMTKEGDKVNLEEEFKKQKPGYKKEYVYTETEIIRR